MSDKIKLAIFDGLQMAVAGAGQHGWWKCMGCGAFSGFESSPTASAVTPWCRTGKHWDEEGNEVIPLSGYTLVRDEPVPEGVEF